ncbi:protein-tyrosine phosphatase-like protein [Thamnidium elegans]|nr:protein-tyrosine phosphatase-like protein [Thamnidium elegans]
MQRLHPEQQHSSLGISKALNEEVRLLQEGERTGTGQVRKSLTDNNFKRVPTKEANIFTWTRFMISLYYNKLAVNMFGFLTGWSWFNRVDQYIILGALPTPSQIKRLHKEEKVDVVINMCSEFPGYEKLYKELNITQIRLETPDFCIPSLDSIESGINQIVALKQQLPKSSIYLHCKAGRGRSAAIAICYLLRTYQMDLSQSQQMLLKKRHQVDKDLCQTDEIHSRTM